MREAIISYSQAKAFCVLGIKPISKAPVEVPNIVIENGSVTESGTVLGSGDGIGIRTKIPSGTEISDDSLNQNEILISEVNKSSSGTIPFFLCLAVLKYLMFFTFMILIFG